MFFFILLLIQLLLIQARVTDNCFRFASSFAFAPCIQCEAGYYMTDGLCHSCTDGKQKLDQQIKLQCQMSQSFSYGTNRGFTPRYNQSSNIQKSRLPPSLSDLFAKNSKPQPSQPEQLPPQTQQEFIPDPNCTRFQPLSSEDHQKQLICVECKQGFYLNQLTHSCIIQTDVSTDSVIKEEQDRNLQHCVIYSIPEQKCFECQDAYKFNEADGMCYNEKIVLMEQPVNSKQQKPLQTVAKQPEYKVLVNEDGNTTTSQQIVDEAIILDSLPQVNLNLNDAVIDLSEKNNFLSRVPTQLELIIKQNSNEDNIQGQIQQNMEQNKSKEQLIQQGNGNQTQKQIIQVHHNDTNDNDTNISSDPSAQQYDQSQNSTQKDMLDSNVTNFVQEKYQNQIPIFKCVQYEPNKKMCKKCQPSYLLNRLSNSCIKLFPENNKDPYYYGYYFTYQQKTPKIQPSKQINCQKYDELNKKCLFCNDEYYLNLSGECMSREQYRNWLANYRSTIF